MCFLCTCAEGRSVLFENCVTVSALFLLQELLQEVKGQQAEMDKFTDEAQTLQQLTSESRVGNFVSQLTSRYQGLLVTTKVSAQWGTLQSCDWGYSVSWSGVLLLGLQCSMASLGLQCSMAKSRV